MADGLVSISTEQWNRSIALYSSALGKTMREALYEEWPLLIRKVMDFTPPFKTGGSKGSSDLSVGRAAVNRDIRKTMRPFDPANKRTKQLQKIVDERNLTLFNLLANRSKKGPMVGLRAVTFSPKVHTSQRNARGRVGADKRQVVLGSDSGHLLEYIKHVQDNVGIAKAGWWPALSLVGGGAPGYVIKHGTGHGSVIDGHADEDPSITAINRTPWAVRKDEAQRIINAALASRAKAIESKVRAKLRQAAKEAKLTAA